MRAQPGQGWRSAASSMSGGESSISSSDAISWFDFGVRRRRLPRNRPAIFRAGVDTLLGAFVLLLDALWDPVAGTTTDSDASKTHRSMPASSQTMWSKIPASELLSSVCGWVCIGSPCSAGSAKADAGRFRRASIAVSSLVRMSANTYEQSAPVCLSPRATEMSGMLGCDSPIFAVFR